MIGSKPGKTLSSSVLQLANLGVELAAAVGGGCLLGYWCDRRFETQPWGILIGSTVGIVGGLYNMIRKAVRESLRSQHEAPGPGPASGAGGQDRRPDDDQGEAGR